MKREIKSIVLVALAATSCQSFGEGLVTKYAKESGYKACLSTVSDIETFFAKDSDYGTWSFVAKDNPNDQVLNATLELTYSDSATLIDFTIAPTRDNTCSYTYTRTFYSDESCMATSKKSYMKNATYKGEINKKITGFNDGSSRFLLMPAGSGCVVQKKEIGFRFNKQNS